MENYFERRNNGFNVNGLTTIHLTPSEPQRTKVKLKVRYNEIKTHIKLQTINPIKRNGGPRNSGTAIYHPIRELLFD